MYIKSTITVVPYWLFTTSRSTRGHEAESAEAVVKADDDDVTVQSQGVPRIHLARAKEERSAVDPHHDGQLATSGGEMQTSTFHFKIGQI